MLILWRRIVVWVRSLLISWFFKKEIKWGEKVTDLTNIINDAIPAPLPKPVEPTPILPKQPLRNFLRKFFK